MCVVLQELHVPFRGLLIDRGNSHSQDQYLPSDLVADYGSGWKASCWDDHSDGRLPAKLMAIFWNCYLRTIPSPHRLVSRDHILLWHYPGLSQRAIRAWRAITRFLPSSKKEASLIEPWTRLAGLVMIPNVRIPSGSNSRARFRIIWFE